MFISELEIDNFKSFARKTRIPFSQGFTVVSGPNGSGKSNIIDAVRWVLGDEAFFRGVRNYYNDPAVANGFASHEAVVKHFEAAGDTSLTEFFQDWYYGEGFPVYTATYRPENAGQITLTISQTPSHPSVPFFEMPVPVRLYNHQRTDSADFRLIHTHNNQTYLLNTGFEVAEVKIDPDYNLAAVSTSISRLDLPLARSPLEIFPNPFNHKIDVRIPDGERIISLRLFSADGALLKLSGPDAGALNLSFLPEGFYLLEVITSKRTVRKKVVKNDP